MNVQTTTTILIGICIVLVIALVILVILYFRNTPERYFKKRLKENEVDAEIEKELKRKR